MAGSTLRFVLWLVWALLLGWAWHAEVLGATGALALLALGGALGVWRALVGARRRNTPLRYVQTGKHPIGEA